MQFVRKSAAFVLLTMTFANTTAVVNAQTDAKDDFPPHAKILEGYEKVVTKANIVPMYQGRCYRRF